MCEPTTIATIAVSLLSAGAAAYTANQAGKQQEAWGNYQAAQTEADARAEKGAAQVEAERIRKLGKRQIAEAMASYAASGVDLSEGTPLDINREIAADVEEDAALAIMGGNDRALRLNAQAQSDRIGAGNARSAGRYNAANSLLQGASGAMAGWKKSASAGGGSGVKTLGSSSSNYKGGG